MTVSLFNDQDIVNRKTNIFSLLWLSNLQYFTLTAFDFFNLSSAYNNNETYQVGTIYMEIPQIYDIKQDTHHGGVSNCLGQLHIWYSMCHCLPSINVLFDTLNITVTFIHYCSAWRNTSLDFFCTMFLMDFFKQF